jgi:hypothetical protein
MLEFNAERLRANVRQATTEDLLDRATVYSDGMEPDALDVIEAELSRRGVTRQDLEAHADRHRRESTLPPGDGPAPRCSFCHRPAVRRGWGWHRLWKVLPVFPRPIYYCAAHARGGTTSPAPGRPPLPGG